jgi:hypothetical protein
MSDENKMGNVELTTEELELFKKLQHKVKAAKEQGKELVTNIFKPIFEATEIDKVFNAISLNGGERISKTIKLDDGRKLNLCFRDVTNLGKKDDED